MTARPAAPQAIVDLTAGLDIDVADVIAHVSEYTAKELRKQGFGGHGCDADYDIGVYYGDREIAESLLGRPMTRPEVTALEACIRYYLRAAEEGATS